MKKIILPIFLLISLIAFSIKSQGQTYYQVTVLTGTQLLGTTTVTVVGTGGNYGFYNFCGPFPGPYLPGNSGPGNFLFTFSTPVNKLRFKLHGAQNQEVCTIQINGVAYALGAANNLVTCATCTGTCQDPLGSFVGGNFVGIPGSGGEFTIENVTGGISSVKFLHNGVQAGTAFSIEFQEGLNPVATNNGPVCWGDTLKLFGEPSLSSLIYSWTGPNGFSSNFQNPIIPNPSAADAGDYILTINGVYSDTTSVVLLPRPSDPVISFTTPVCAGNTLDLNAISDAGATYNWTGPSSFTSSVANPSISNIQPSNSGIYTVQADMAGCLSEITSATVTVYQPSSSTISKSICEGESYNFNGNLITNAGTYTDQFKNRQGCDSTATLNLTIKPPLPLTFDFDQSELRCVGDTITIKVSGAVNYVWTNKTLDVFMGEGDSKVVNLINLKNQYAVIGTDTNNCKGFKEVTIVAQPCCDVMVPNAFTPNMDGNNDYFGVFAKGFIRDFQLRIFDRFGHTVFVSFNPKKQWDGTINGKPANTGVYYYTVKGKCDYGPDIFEKGDLTLIR